MKQRAAKRHSAQETWDLVPQTRHLRQADEAEQERRLDRLRSQIERKSWQDGLQWAGASDEGKI